MRYIKSILLVTVMLFFSSKNIYAQNSTSQEIDSLKNIDLTNYSKKEVANINKQLFSLYSEVDKEIAVVYGEKYLDYLLESNQKKDKLTLVYYELGVNYMDIDLSLSKEYIDLSLKNAIKNENDSLIALNYLATATFYTRRPNIDSSIHYSLLATRFFKQIKDTLSLVYCYHNLMSNYNDVDNNEKTLKYGNLGLKLAKIKNEIPVIGSLEVGLGFIHSKIGNDSLADFHISNGKEIAKKMNNQYLLLQLYFTTGAKKYTKEKYKESHSDYQNALKIAILRNDSIYMSLASFLIGQINFKTNNYKLAEKHLLNTLIYKQATKEVLKDTYLYLSLIYSNKDNLKKNSFFKKYDKIYQEFLKSKSEDVLIKYETSEKEREIEHLKLKEAENQLEIQKNKIKSTTLYSALSISIILLIFLFYRYKSRKEIFKQKLELEKQKANQTKQNLIQKERELTLKIDAIKNNNLVIEELKTKLETIPKNDDNIKYILKSFDQNYVSDKQWDNIITHFNSIEKEFVTKLQESHSNISKNDIKLSILMNLNYSNSGMAEILNITIEGVKKAKQRLKKKLI